MAFFLNILVSTLHRGQRQEGDLMISGSTPGVGPTPILFWVVAARHLIAPPIVAEGLKVPLLVATL